jgi:Spy/CpxP family protein refolding chaperone
MKKIIIGMMALALTFSAMAQKNDKANKNNDQQKEFKKKGSDGDKNVRQLNLTDAQKAQMKTINNNFRQQMQDLKKQGNITVDEQKQKREALAKEHKDKIAAILTPEQRNQAAAYAKERKGNKKEGSGNDRFEEMTKDLHLNADQTAKMTSINSSFKANMQSIRQNSALQQDEKRDQMKKLMKQHRSDMEALLTNDQKVQFKSIQKNRSNRSAVK